MENMNIENIAEEVVEKVEEVVPVEVKNSEIGSYMFGGFVGGAVAYGVCVGIGKLVKLWKSRKNQKIKTIDEDAIETALPAIDEEEAE